MSLQIKGMAELNRKLDRIRRDIRPEMRAATEKALAYVHSRVPPYPSPPPDSTYRRTGTLGRSITTQVRELGTQMVGVIGTNVVYAPYVIDEKRQAAMHSGRWWTLQAVVRKARAGVRAIYRAAIRDLLGKR